MTQANFLKALITNGILLKRYCSGTGLVTILPRLKYDVITYLFLFRRKKVLEVYQQRDFLYTQGIYSGIIRTRQVL